MGIEPQLLEAITLLKKPIISKVFQLIANQLGLSGWAVARNLDLNPDETEKILNELKEKDVVRSTEPGLEGNYSLSGLGFVLKEQLKTRRFSR